MRRGGSGKKEVDEEGAEEKEAAADGAGDEEVVEALDGVHGDEGQGRKCFFAFSSSRSATEQITPDKATAIQGKLSRAVLERCRDSQQRAKFFAPTGTDARAAAPVETPTEERTDKFAKGDAQVVRTVEDNSFAFEMRSALGQRWQRDMKKPQTKKAFEGAPDPQKWKQEWIEKQYKGAIERQKTFTDSYDESWIKHGKRVSFLRMCYEEGGPRGQFDEETIENCYKTCTRCMEIGFPFVSVDEQNGSVKFMHFNHEYQEKFTKRWEQTDKQNENKSSVVMKRPAGRQQADDDADGDDGAEGGDGGDNQGAENKPRTDSKKTVTEATKRLQMARRVIVSIQSTLQSAKSLESSISELEDAGATEREDEWAWARTPVVLGKIKAETKAVEATVKNNQLWQKIMTGTELSKAPIV